MTTLPPAPPPASKPSGRKYLTKRNIGIGGGILVALMVISALASPRGQQGLADGVADTIASPTPTAAPTPTPTPEPTPSPTPEPTVTPEPTPTTDPMLASLLAAIDDQDCSAMEAAIAVLAVDGTYDAASLISEIGLDKSLALSDLIDTCGDGTPTAAPKTVQAKLAANVEAGKPFNLPYGDYKVKVVSKGTGYGYLDVCPVSGGQWFDNYQCEDLVGPIRNAKTKTLYLYGVGGEKMFLAANSYGVRWIVTFTPQ